MTPALLKSMTESQNKMAELADSCPLRASTTFTDLGVDQSTTRVGCNAKRGKRTEESGGPDAV